MRTPPADPSPSPVTPGLPGFAGAPGTDGPGATAPPHAAEASARSAVDAVLPAVYDELRREAARVLARERPGHTLQPTALVHEAYLRLADQRRAGWESRTQFFAVAAHVMRRVLVDYARTRRAAKRGGGAVAVTLTSDAGAGTPPDDELGVDVLALDEALTRLAAVDPERARLIELRFFAGLTIAESAVALGVSPATAGRAWTVARLWLRRELAR